MTGFPDLDPFFKKGPDLDLTTICALRVLRRKYPVLATCIYSIMFQYAVIFGSGTEFNKNPVPDPEKQCCGSMTFWGGSGSGSADPWIHASD